MSKRIDLTGRVFGRLTVIKYAGYGKDKAIWHCRCECGNEKNVAGIHLRRGLVVSCGCYMRERSSERIRERNLTHGQAHTRLYKLWVEMIRRCENERAHNFYLYGARGIKICERWHKFEAFFEDMGAGYAPGLTIDRIDVNGGYCKENCRWTTWEGQAQNRRNTIRFHGVSLKKYCRDNGLNYEKIVQRVEGGWPIEKAVQTK